MESRSFYKVSIGSRPGGKFVWRNDCRKIEGTFSCSLTPVTKQQASQLSGPPGYAAGESHKYFTPSFSGTPTSTSLAGDLKQYDCTGCTVGGNEFLLTDHSLGLYCVTKDTALLILSRMFYFDLGGARDFYAADGSQFKYGITPYLRCMYGNGIVRSVSYDNATGAYSFTLQITSKDGFSTDVLHAYCLMEVDHVIDGYYRTDSESEHRYSYEVKKFDADLLPGLVSDPTLFDNVPSYPTELVESTVDATANAAINWSWGLRENLIHAAGSSSPVYDFVFSDDVLSGEYVTSAYHVTGRDNRRFVLGQVSSDPSNLSEPSSSSSSGEPASRMTAYYVVGWDVPPAPTAFTASVDDYQKVSLSFSAASRERDTLVIFRDGVSIARFKFWKDTLSFTNKLYVDWTMESGGSHVYSTVIQRTDHFGVVSGSALTATGSTLAYNEADLPDISGITYDANYSLGVKYSWTDPVPGSGYSVAGFSYRQTPDERNLYAKFHDVNSGRLSRSGGGSSYFKLDKENIDRLYVRYSVNGSVGKEIYSKAGAKIIEVKKSSVIYGAHLLYDDHVFTVKWRSLELSADVKEYRVYCNDNLVETLPAVSSTNYLVKISPQMVTHRVPYSIAGKVMHMDYYRELVYGDMSHFQISCVPNDYPAESSSSSSSSGAVTSIALPADEYSAVEIVQYLKSVPENNVFKIEAFISATEEGYTGTSTMEKILKYGQAKYYPAGSVTSSKGSSNTSDESDKKAGMPEVTTGFEVYNP